MTGYTVHTGSSKKFASGWDKIFKGGAQGAAAKSQAGQQSKSKQSGGKKTSK